MGDFGLDTAVEGGDGRYTARLSRDWEIWGPNGGYVAAVVLRAAGAHAGLPRPSSLAMHFLGPADFDEVTIETSTLRAGKRSHSVRVSMTQEDRRIAEAVVWAVADAAGGVGGPEFDWTAMPEVPPPDTLATLEERLVESGEAVFPFWQNFDMRPVDWMSREEWEQERPAEPRQRAWFRFRPTAVFEDPYVEAGRVAALLDLEGWPAGARAMPPETDGRWMAPNMDLAVSFHQPPSGADYLLIDMQAPISAGGLIGAHGQVWTADGRLVGTGLQQLLLREAAPPHRKDG